MHIIEFIEEQLRERYKNFIIFGPPLMGKTMLAKSISEEKSCLYIDFLEKFKEDKVLKEEIDIFGPEKFRKYIVNIETKGKDFIIIDHIDFLINTWDKSQMQEFTTFIEMDDSKKCYLFIMQEYKQITKMKIRNDKGNKRNLNIFDIKQGGIING